jgi:hypothetical protein
VSKAEDRRKESMLKAKSKTNTGKAKREKEIVGVARDSRAFRLLNMRTGEQWQLTDNPFLINNMVSDAKVANRNSMDDGQRLHFRGVRVALGTGYSPGEGNQRASQNGRVSSQNPNSPIGCGLLLGHGELRTTNPK